jgi:predicted esterase
MMQLLPRRAGRDPLGSDRLVSGNYNHHYRQFRGGAIADWPETTKVPRRMVVGLHGLGANERQFATLLALDLPDNSVYVGLRAPVDYGRDAFSWFNPLLDADQITYDPVVERVADFVLAIRQRTGVSATDTTVMGYSQAAPLTAAISALRPDVAANVVLGSGAQPPGLAALGPGRPDRAFVGVGNKDPLVDADSLAELTAAWASVTGGLTVRHYDIPHVMSPAMTDDISQWIRAR